MKKIEFAPQDRIEAYDALAEEFFQSVLGLAYRECFVSDESRLSDFAGCGLSESVADATDGQKTLNDAWDAWVVPLIAERYGVADVSPTVLMVDLFDEIEKVRGRRLH